MCTCFGATKRMLCVESAASQKSPASCFRIMTEADSEDEDVVIVKVTPAPKPKKRPPLQRLNVPPSEVILISDDEEEPPSCKMSDKRQTSPEGHSGPPRYKAGGKRLATLEDYGYSPSKRMKLPADADSRSGPSHVRNGLLLSPRRCIPKAISNHTTCSSELRPSGTPRSHHAHSPSRSHHAHSPSHSHHAHSPSRSPHRPINHVQSPSYRTSTTHHSRRSIAKPSLAATSPSAGIPPPSTPPPNAPPHRTPPRPHRTPPPTTPPPSAPPRPHRTPPPTTPPPSAPPRPPSVPHPSAPPPPPSVPPPSAAPPPPSVPHPSAPPPPPSVPPPSATPPPPSVPPPSAAPPPPSVPPPSAPPPPPSVSPSAPPPIALPSRTKPEPALSTPSTCTSPAASANPGQPLTPEQPEAAIRRPSTSSGADGRPLTPNIHKRPPLKRSPTRSPKLSVIPMWPLPSSSRLQLSSPKREPPWSPASSSTGTFLPQSVSPTPPQPPQHNHPPSELNPPSSSSLNCNASVYQPTPSPADPLGTKVRLDPPFCCIPPCSLISCRQFSPHETRALDIYEGGSSVVNYLSVMEKLVSQGSYIPSGFLKRVLALVNGVSDEGFVRKMHAILCHDLAIRADTDVCEETVWGIMEQGLSTLQSHLASQDSDAQATALAAEVVLNYLFGLLVKDLNSKIDSPRSSLVRKILSLRTKWPHVRKIIDLLFALYPSDQGVPSQSGMPDLQDVLLALICLPLLTCEDTDRKELAMKLARELSQQLGTLGSAERKCQFLVALPSDYLRERVISVHLENNFIVHPSAGINSDNHCPSDCVSLASISSVHLCRTPYNHSGVPQDLGLFLSLLCQLLQSHLHTLHAEPLLSFLHASTPQDLPPSWRTVPSPLPQDDLRASLLSIQFQVSALTYRLFEDPAIQCELTTLPTNWLYLQLLTSLAEPT